MRTFKPIFSERNFVIAATILTIVAISWAINERANQNHFQLSMNVGRNCMSINCESKELVNVRNSNFPGKHQFILYPVTGETSVYGGVPSNISKTTGSSESYFQHGGMVLEHGMGCGVGLEFSDDKHLSLVGISTYGDDGFGPVQGFVPIQLYPEQVYRIMDIAHPRGLQCMFQPAKNGRIHFAVYTKSWESKF